MSIRKLFDGFLPKVDIDEVKKRCIALCELERPQTTPAQYRAGKLVYDLCVADGLSNVEFIEFPLDGKTAYQDKIMPIAWDASVGKLTLVGAKAANWHPVNTSATFDPDVLADYQEDSFSLVQGSVATPPGGLDTRIVSESQFLSGDDVTGALVMFDASTRAGSSNLSAILDEGAIGFVTDYTHGRYFSPDTKQWVTGISEYVGNWHPIAGERDFIGFSVTPRIGDLLRAKLSRGAVKVHIESDGRRYAGTTPVITATVPGRRPEELWLLSDTCEPFLDDDAGGIASCLEVARLIRQCGTPEYTIRVVFGMELYGYAAYADYRGGNLNGKVIGGINLDSLGPRRPGCGLNLHQAGLGKPYIGNKFLADVYAELKDKIKLTLNAPTFMDDACLGDTMVGIPTTWLIGDGGGLWHNAVQCNPEIMDWNGFKDVLALAAAFTDKVVNYTGPAAEFPEVEIKETHSKMRDYAAKLVFKRNTCGFPYALAKVPVEERFNLPNSVMYGPFANVLCYMDGKKNLAQIINEVEARTGAAFSESLVATYVNRINALADYGYLEVIQRQSITGEDIQTALQKLGVTPNDVLLVHCGVSKCGHIAGGADTLIKAIASSCDTALFTTFTRPYIILGNTNRGWNYRAFNSFEPKNPRGIWTGSVGKALLKHFPEAIRSKHITHSWAGLGKHAAECLLPQGAYDAPAGANSPLEMALKFKGKVLFYGAGLDTTTFLHYLEDRADLPFLQTAICKERLADGSSRCIAIPKHLPGHREFYKDAEKSKFYTRAVAAGLQIKKMDFGCGELHLIDLEELFRIGTELVKQDPGIFLCDNPECRFCQSYKK